MSEQKVGHENAQKVVTTVFTSKMMFFKIFQKFNKYLAHFCKNIFCKKLLKIAQSGHFSKGKYHPLLVRAIDLGLHLVVVVGGPSGPLDFQLQDFFFFFCR